MNRLSKLDLAIAVVGALVAILVILAFARPGRAQYWTDGGELRTPAANAPVREVLWLPAKPLKGIGLGAVDEYEPRYSADGTVMVFPRRRPGRNADLFPAFCTRGGWGEAKPIDSINTKDNE